MKRIKILSLLVSSIMTVSLLAGCGQKDTSGTSTSGGSGKAEITFWECEDPQGVKVVDDIIKEFSEKNPNITIKKSHYDNEELRKNFISSAQTGNGPDIVHGPNDNLGVFATGNLVQNVEDFMGQDFLKNFDQKSLESAKYDGKQYMIPDRNGNELLIIYNKKLVPQAPKTWEELEQISKKLVEEKKVKTGFVYNTIEPFFTIPFLAAFGGQVFDKPGSKDAKATLNTLAVKDWMTFIKRIQDEGIAEKGIDYDASLALFKEEKAAFILNGPWSFNTFKEAKIDFGIIPIPSINGKYPAPYASVKGYSISSSLDKSKKEAVKKFIEYVTSKDVQLKLVDITGQLPTNVEALKDGKILNNPLLVAQKEILDKALPMPIIPQMRAVWDAAKPIQQEVLSGKTKPEDAPAKMQQKAEEGIKALGF